MKNEPTVKQIRELAAEANVDERTAKKALTEGVETIRTRDVKERLRAAMKARR
jgi:hypothetical protein